MKLALTVDTDDASANLDRRFGRCAYFVIVDTEKEVRDVYPNPAAEATGGAGPMAAQFLASQGVEAIISGEFGPKAFTALEAADIHMYSAKGGSVDQLVADFQADRHVGVTSSTHQRGHGGRGGRGRRRQ